MTTTQLPTMDRDAQIAAALLRASAALTEAAALLANRNAAQSPTAIGLPDLLRIEQVADMTGVPVNTLRTWRQTKKGPQATRLGGRLVWDRSEVEAWIQAQFSQGRSQARG